MAVRVYCDNPETLLRKIKAAVREGSVETWELDEDEDFTHVPQQWRGKAWLKPRTGENSLVFNIVGQKDTEMSSVIYAIYHGRFIEMLLSHFDDSFDRASATSLPVAEDNI